MEKKAWPYMAGIMDSEGSINISISRKSSGSEAFNLMIQVTNTNRRLVDWIVSNFGGSFCAEVKKNSFSPGSKIFRWYLYGKENQETFLLGIIPYLIVKKKQALLALDFIRLGRDTEKRRSIWTEMKSCNSREVATPDLLPKTDKAPQYVAGYLDGDGTICGTYHRGLNISITSTDFIVIKWLLANFGGKFYTRDRQRVGSKGKNRIIHQWFISGSKNKERFLLDIIPYMLLKKEQAKSLLEIVRLRRLDPNGQDAGISAHVQELNDKIRDLNRDPVRDSATTDMPDASDNSEVKTQSEHSGRPEERFCEDTETQKSVA